MVNNKITEISPKMVFTVKDRIQDLLDLTDFYHRRMDFVLFSVSLCVSYRNLDKGDHANHAVESVIQETREKFLSLLMLDGDV